MRTISAFVLLLCLTCFAFTPLAGQSPTPAPAALPSPTAIQLEHFSPSQVDTSIDPCVDFFSYTCSKYFKENPIPPDQPMWGTGSPLMLWNDSLLRQTLEELAAKKGDLTPNEKKLADYWTTCMDEASIEKSAPGELKAELHRIEEIKNKEQLIEEIAHYHGVFPGSWDAEDNQTGTVFFGFTASQDYNDATRVIATFDQAGMHLPGRDFYLVDDPQLKAIRERYVIHIANMLQLTGESADKAAADAKMILALETELAKAMMDNVRRRDPQNVNNKMSLAQFQALIPSLNIKRYLELVHAPASESYLISSPDFFRELEKMMQSHPLEDWKVYLRWSATSAAAPAMNHALLEENWNFFGKIMSGAPEMQPRWRRCVHSADHAMGEALGQAYVQRAFPPESKKLAVEMVESVEGALDQDVQQIQWMTPETKAHALEKLHLIIDKIGYPDKWRDYSALKLTRSSYFANMNAASEFERNRWVQKIGKPVDRSEWVLTPSTVNAYYDAQLNAINFPAGILHAPLFDPQQDLAANYGSVGSIIGHEITHGFDDQGRKFDGHGTLHDWWTAADTKAYEEHAKCISDEYTMKLPDLDITTNGLLTIGEDVADNGGVNLALIALVNTLRAQGKPVDAVQSNGLTATQEFFLSFANGACMQYRPQVMRNVIMSNPHSLPKFRVNNVFANMPEFAKAFGCKAGQPMVHQNACRVW